MLITPESGSYSARLSCRYLLHIPDEIPANPVLALTLHGYGSNSEVMLRLTVPFLGPGHIIASLEAPFQHYHATPPTATTEVGFNWGIRDRHQDAVRLHHEMVLAVLDRLRQRFSVPSARCLLVGFSQSVGLNYRFIGTHPAEAGAVIGICGGVPRDWEESKYQAVKAPLLHISRNQDEVFPVETANQFPDRLRRHASDVEFHMLPGGHRFPSKASSIVKPWLARVFPI